MGAHLGERGEFLVANGTNDGALGDAVAAAHLGIVRHRGDIGGGRLAGDRFRDGAAEHQPFAQGTHVLVVAHQLQVPWPVGDIAVEHGADQLAVAQHDLLVDARGNHRAA